MTELDASTPAAAERTCASDTDAREADREPEPELWARVTGVLPRTPNSLYAAPFIANATDYEVRYCSLSSVGRSLPYRAYFTIHDRDIAAHYLESVGPGWTQNSTFVVWFGPPGVHEFPPEVEGEDALYVPWGSSFFGGQVPFPGLLFRQILSRGQVLGPDRDHHSGLAEIIPKTCSWGAVDGEQRNGEERPPACREDEERELCCGPSAPEWCFEPRHVAAKLRSYYPTVEYFVRRGAGGGSQQQQPLQRLGGEGGEEKKGLRPLPGTPQSASQSDAAARSVVGSFAARLWDLLNGAMWWF